MHELGKRIERETNVRVEFAGFDELKKTSMKLLYRRYTRVLMW